MRVVRLKGFYWRIFIIDEIIHSPGGVSIVEAFEEEVD